MLKYIIGGSQTIIIIRPDILPETFLVSAGGTLFPDRGCDGTFLVCLAHWQLLPLGVPPEEGPAGVAGDSTVVTAGLAQSLLAHSAGNLTLGVGHDL